MAVFFWYFVKSDLSGVHYSTRVHYTCQFLHVTTRPCMRGHPVWKGRGKPLTDSCTSGVIKLEANTKESAEYASTALKDQLCYNHCSNNYD